MSLPSAATEGIPAYPQQASPELDTSEAGIQGEDLVVKQPELQNMKCLKAAFQHELVHTIEPQMSAHIRKWFHRSKDESPLAEEGLRYKSLKPKKHHVRLIKFEARRPNEAHLLNLSLHTVSLDSKPAYHCLSYVWGVPTFTWPVYVDGHLVHITPTLGAALIHLEHEKDLQTLWADGICINQRDDAEKEDQVKMMARIYGECVANVAWLGLDDDQLYAAMHLLNTTGVRIFRSLAVGWMEYVLGQVLSLNEGDVTDSDVEDMMSLRDAMALHDVNDTKDPFEFNGAHEFLTRDIIADILATRHIGGYEAFFRMRGELLMPTNEDFEDLIVTWETLMARPFWKRIWIVQELIKPDVVFLRCGSVSTRLEYLCAIRNFVEKIAHTGQDPIPGVPSFAARCMRLRNCLTNPGNSLQFIAATRHNMFSQPKTTEAWDTIHVMLRECWQMESTLNLDKVYGLMSVSADLPVLQDLVSYRLDQSAGSLGMEIMRLTLIRHGLRHFQEGLWFLYPIDPYAEEIVHTLRNPYWPSWANIGEALFPYPNTMGPLFMIHKSRSEIAFRQFRACGEWTHQVAATDFKTSTPKFPRDDILRVPCRVVGEIKRQLDLATRTWSQDADDYETAQLEMGYDVIKEVEDFFHQEPSLEAMLRCKPLQWLFSLQSDVPNMSAEVVEFWQKNMEEYAQQYLALKNRTPHPTKCTPHRAIMIQWIEYNSPFTLDSGYVGVGPLPGMPGDKVVIFPDNDTPWVLKNYEGGYKILGQAYVLGAMNGEVLDLDPPVTMIDLM
ncbi:heterokaryon incompatibility protein-domain-containing protein [Rhexocercosporidium sp. MPI-PUGE-AT-0058]|nr:heterokaryon incompatibility protein-domain-containing protein [Rhexocercosporidium sp. MPI-PUGE-AT-0058]